MTHSVAGAMVMELLPYNWEWKGVSRIYKNITKSMGDIHHFAWRAKHPKWGGLPLRARSSICRMDSRGVRQQVWGPISDNVCEPK